MKNPKLFRQLQSLTTEQRNRWTMGIDLASVNDTLRLINAEDRKIAAIVGKEIPSIAKAVTLVVRSFKSGGRLFYVGAGTSGRLGILDASECPPTFGSNPSMVQGLIAGGRKAVFQSQEGAEDLEKEGALEIRRKKISPKDTVCGIAASMRTPYVLGALGEAKRRGAGTIIVTTNPRSKLALSAFAKLRRNVDVAICPEVGPEVIMGSTRMKSGTAQKLVLNMITTTSMIQLGKIYENMMVDLRMTSKKLEERAKKVIMIAAEVSYDRAAKALKDAGGHVKSAIVMLKGNITLPQAKKRLRKSNGFVRPALAINERKRRA